MTRSRAPGAELRSRLNWLILKTLAVDVGMHLSAAELTQLLWECASRNPGQALHRRRHPNVVSSYLYRLAGRGLLKLEGLKRRRRVYLTPGGRRALESLEARVSGPDGAGLPPDVLKGLAAVRTRSEHRGAWSDMLQRLERRHARLPQEIEGRPRETAFVSYDLPASDVYRRHRIVQIVKAHGFRRMHQSMYTGPAWRLRAALEEIEMLGVIPRVRWGTLTIYSP